MYFFMVANKAAWKSTTEQIFNLRILCEKYLQHQQHLYHVLMDFKMAFDRGLNVQAKVNEDYHHVHKSWKFTSVVSTKILKAQWFTKKQQLDIVINTDHHKIQRKMSNYTEEGWTNLNPVVQSWLWLAPKYIYWESLIQILCDLLVGSLALNPWTCPRSLCHVLL